MATLSELTNRVAQRLSMVSGTGIQIYAEDRIAEMIQHKFDIVFDEFWWPKYNKWSTYVLDGSTGVVTTDLTDIIKRFEDIKSVFISGTERRVPILSSEVNPNILEGTTPIAYEALDTASRVFKVWPITATGSLDLNYRTKPDNFTATDTIDIDEQLMILGATWDYLEDDGTNPSATQKMQALFEDRMSQLTSLHAKRPVPLDQHAFRPESITITTL